MLGLKGLQVGENARRIVDHPDQLGRDLHRFRYEFLVVVGQISHAKARYDEIDKQVDRLGTVIALPMEKGLPELPDSHEDAE